jgi:hypothetical protein
MLLQMNTDAQAQLQTTSTPAIQQCIDKLHEHYGNNEIDLRKSLYGLSTDVAKQHK